MSNQPAAVDDLLFTATQALITQIVLRSSLRRILLKVRMGFCRYVKSVSLI
jgi:hypothetical protein